MFFIAFAAAVVLSASSAAATELGAAPTKKPATTQNTGFNLTLGEPEVVVSCAGGAQNIYNTWIKNGASGEQATNAFDSYYDNCMCGLGIKKYCY